MLQRVSIRPFLIPYPIPHGITSPVEESGQKPENAACSP
jgi:hypothetical protein